MNTTQVFQGILYASAGLLLFLYTMGYLEHGVGIILTIIAIGLILYGLQLMGAYQLIMHYTNKVRKVAPKAGSQQTTKSEQSSQSSTRQEESKTSKSQQTGKSKSTKSDSKS